MLYIASFKREGYDAQSLLGESERAVEVLLNSSAQFKGTIEFGIALDKFHRQRITIGCRTCVWDAEAVEVRCV